MLWEARSSSRCLEESRFRAKLKVSQMLGFDLTFIFLILSMERLDFSDDIRIFLLLKKSWIEDGE